MDLADETHWVDTGFIVFNDRNYPNFEPLLEELGVATQPSHMSFSVADDAGSFEYASTPRGLFAQRSHLVDRRFLRMVRDLVRFNREAASLLELGPGEGPSLREFLREGGYSDWFVQRLIVPQASAVWSADPAQMWSFPAGFLARFFHNHGMLGFRDRPQWRTVSGGSHRYVEAITGPFADRIRLSAPVREIRRDPAGVSVSADGCETERYDEVVIAAHSDQALACWPTHPTRSASCWARSPTSATRRSCTPTARSCPNGARPGPAGTTTCPRASRPHHAHLLDEQPPAAAHGDTDLRDAEPHRGHRPIAP